MDRFCKFCSGVLKPQQKSYCSRSCQAVGVALQNRKAIVLMRNCLFCQTEFEYHPNWKSEENSKYCKRRCKDQHQSILYSGKNAPGFGKKWSQERREKQIIKAQKYWTNVNNLNKHKRLMQEFFEVNGYQALKPDVVQKREQTCVERYGVKHPWMNPKIRQKCEITTYELYGKYTWDIARDAVHHSETNLEKKIFQLLCEAQIEFVFQYELIVGSLKRKFDFYLPQHNLLIEVDGDYWHGNPTMYSVLDETQQRTHQNDLIKNEMVKQTTLKLIRFWGSQIMQPNFSFEFYEKIKNQS